MTLLVIKNNGDFLVDSEVSMANGLSYKGTKVIVVDTAEDQQYDGSDKHYTTVVVGSCNTGERIISTMFQLGDPLTYEHKTVADHTTATVYVICRTRCTRSRIIKRGSMSAKDVGRTQVYCLDSKLDGKPALLIPTSTDANDIMCIDGSGWEVFTSFNKLFDTRISFGLTCAVFNGVSFPIHEVSHSHGTNEVVQASNFQQMYNDIIDDAFNRFPGFIKNLDFNKAYSASCDAPKEWSCSQGVAPYVILRDYEIDPNRMSLRNFYASKVEVMPLNVLEIFDELFSSMFTQKSKRSDVSAFMHEVLTDAKDELDNMHRWMGHPTFSNDSSSGFPLCGQAKVVDTLKRVTPFPISIDKDWVLSLETVDRAFDYDLYFALKTSEVEKLPNQADLSESVSLTLDFFVNTWSLLIAKEIGFHTTVRHDGAMRKFARKMVNSNGIIPLEIDDSLLNDDYQRVSTIIMSDLLLKHSV